MEDQGKRMLLAIVAAFGVMMAWTLLFPAEKKQAPKPDPAEVAKDPGETADPTTPASPTGPQPGQDTPATAPVGVDVPCDDTTPVVREYERVRVAFSRCGATMRSWELLGGKYLGKAAIGDGARGQMDLVPLGRDELARAFALRFDQSPIDPRRVEWQVAVDEPNKVAFHWLSPPDASGVSLEVIKTFVLFPEEFLVELTIDVINHSKVLNSAPQKVALGVALFGYQDPTADTGGGWTQVEREWKSACNMGGDIKHKGAKSLAKSSTNRAGNVRWAGFDHSYFLVVAAPQMQGESDRLECNASAVAPLGGMSVEIVFPAVEMQQGNVLSRRLVAYMGPKFLDQLELVDNDHKTSFADSIDLGWFTLIARPMLWLLQWFHGFVMSWGIAIVFLTIVVKLATLYWTTKSMRSMKAMAKLKPQIEALQKKFKDDKQRQQQEMMNLYKAHKVNPLAGCLPLLLQMPIWFALYKMIMKAAELYHEPFLWVGDLTSPDPILAVLLLIMMFVQAKLSPTTADSTQQKVMMYGLPLMFGVMGFFFPSGLTLYMLTNTFLTALHHLWMNRTDPSTPVKAPSGQAATTRTVAAKATKGGAVVASRRDDDAAADVEDEYDDAMDDGSGGDAADADASERHNPDSRARASRGGAKKRGKRKRR